MINYRVVSVLFFELIFGLFSCIFLVWIFLQLSSGVLSQEILNYDILISQFIYTFRNSTLTNFMIIITTLGSGYVIFSLATIFIVLTWKKHRRESLLFLITTIMGVVLNNLLKIIIERPRPMISPLINESSFSFPSGHAMNSFIFYTLLAYFFYHFTKKRQLSFIFCFFSVLLISLIGFSRVYLGVHYPSDVLAGYIVGLWWFCLVLLFNKTISLLRLFRMHSIN